MHDPATALARLVGFLFLVAVASGFSVFSRLRAGPPLSRVGSVCAALPTMVFLTLFYSLALHMRWSLGAWPVTSNDHASPLALSRHETALEFYANGLLIATVMLWPTAFLVSFLVWPWRRFTAYLGVHGLSFMAGVGLMLLAPAPFLRWCMG